MRTTGGTGSGIRDSGRLGRDRGDGDLTNRSKPVPAIHPATFQRRRTLLQSQLGGRKSRWSSHSSKPCPRMEGLSWSQPESRAAGHQNPSLRTGIHPLPRSPGCEIAVLLRQNSRSKNSHIIFSQDVGKLPGPHHGECARQPEWRSSHRQIHPGWLPLHLVSQAAPGKNRSLCGLIGSLVGRYEDLKNAKPGQYHVRLMDNTKSADCAYPGVEVLPMPTRSPRPMDIGKPMEAPYIV